MNSRGNKSLYKPRQPDFEQKYCTQSYVVGEDDLLYGKILEIYQYKADKLEDTVTVLPDGCFEMVFYFFADHIESHLVIGQSEIEYVPIKECMSGFGIRFIPGWLGHVHNAPLTRTVDIRENLKYISCSEVFKDFDRFYREIVSTGSFERRIEACRSYFGTTERLEDSPSELARQACLYLMNRNGNSSVGELERYLGYSSRYIRKIFDEYVGFSPKTLNEIIRFQYSFYHYYTNPGRSLSDLACEFGYYDLSHMNRSYLKLAKQLPKHLYRKVFLERTV
ncbi:helix-turn-helix domain-containing protein [Cohnella sp. AR92]|uniref:AraC family transcriptional regulator n=1 Tax=Cohnella sp. AR92 TaxID=648716 RepID=UPI0013154CB3|nr:helix-turn-helix domain-containing protein [Cohnella sp. AR92]